MFDGRFRSSVDKGVGPIGTALGRTGLSPDHLTALGLVLAVPAALAIASGRLGLGLLLLIASAIPDLLDGALAKASGTASKRGAFFDSVSDRVTDALILGGLAWYLQSVRHGHAALLPFGVLAVSTLISYERAKAESLGFDAKGGLMERAERIILLCIGLVASVILVPILWAMLILTTATAVQRFAKVWRQATDAIDHEQAEPPAPPTVNPGNRSRSWRQPLPARQGGGFVASPRTSARGVEGDAPHRARRWEEKRAARLRADGDGQGGAGRRGGAGGAGGTGGAGPTGAGGRRHSTRRP